MQIFIMDYDVFKQRNIVFILSETSFSDNYPI